MEMNAEQVINELKRAEQKRYTEERKYRGGDLGQYTDKCNLLAYARITAIGEYASKPVASVMKRAVAEYVHALPENRRIKDYGNYFKHSGYSAYGMSHVFSKVIRAVKSYSKQKFTVFARLGA